MQQKAGAWCDEIVCTIVILCDAIEMSFYKGNA